jgi:hypothetical protein
MGKMVQNFDTKEDRNERYDVLKKLKTPDLIRFSDVVSTNKHDDKGRRVWKTLWSLSWSTENEY